MEHLEEGTIHAWLDGALSSDESRDIERHVAECAICAASVAEARGFIAASSRILSALDNVPGGVLPVAATGGADGGSTPADDLAAQRARRHSNAAGATRRRPWWRHPGFAAAAAAAFVAAGSLLLPRGDDVTVTPTVAQSSPDEFAPVIARADSSGTMKDASANAPPTEPLATRPQAAQPVRERDMLARRKEALAAASDAAISPAPTAQALGATLADSRKPIDEMKIGPVTPMGRASVQVDTGPTRRAAEAENRQRAQLAAVATTGNTAGRVVADSNAAGARSDRSFAPTPPPAARANGAIAERAKARLEPREESMAGASLVGCYALRLVAVGGGPMTIAAVRLPTHIALDGTRAPGSGEIRYEVRDLSPESQRAPGGGTYRWRPTGNQSFDFLIVRADGETAFPAVVGGDPTATEGPVTPMPAGAPVRLAATRERCR